MFVRRPASGWLKSLWSVFTALYTHRVMDLVYQCYHLHITVNNGLLVPLTYDSCSSGLSHTTPRDRLGPRGLPCWIRDHPQYSRSLGSLDAAQGPYISDHCTCKPLALTPKLPCPTGCLATHSPE
jgi:hypothetical protein